MFYGKKPYRVRAVGPLSLPVVRGTRPILAVSMGDPGGIGPEVLAKALANRELRRAAHYRIYGSEEAFAQVCARADIEPFWWSVDARDDLIASARSQDVVLVRLGEGGGVARAPSRLGGELSFRWVEAAIRDAARERDDPLAADAIVTGPISKQAWKMAGHGNFPGHTELLAVRLRARRVSMAFVSERLRVVLATAHLPLMDIRDVLTIGRVHDAIDLGHQACLDLGITRPRIAVCGLNPHAGEGGQLGDEEIRIIEPAIGVARDHGMDVRGPFAGDTVFHRAVDGEFDLVVAMYHDQGLIPVKLLAWDSAVHLTLGLPVIRTSPDHGTAFDIAGRNRANPGSMIRALELAARLARARQIAAPDG